MGGAIQFGFTVDNVDEVYRVALENGAMSVIAPQDLPFGRRAVVEDPDGRPIQFKQPLESDFARERNTKCLT
jgi:predicted enzyme related to lactoylglutathione lyase